MRRFTFVVALLLSAPAAATVPHLLPNNLQLPGGGVLDSWGVLNLCTGSCTALLLGNASMGSLTLNSGSQINLQNAGVTKWIAGGSFLPSTDLSQQIGSTASRLAALYTTSVNSGASQALTLTGSASSSWTLSAGTLSLGADAINFLIGGATSWGINSSNTFFPNADNTQSIGGTGNRVANFVGSQLLSGVSAAAADTAGHSLTTTTQPGGAASATGGGNGGSRTDSTAAGGTSSASLVAGHGGDWSEVTGGGGSNALGGGGARSGNRTIDVGAGTGGANGSIKIGAGTNIPSLIQIGQSGATLSLLGSLTLTDGSVANAALANSNIIVNTTGPIGGGATVPLGGTLTLTCASCVTQAYQTVQSAGAPLTQRTALNFSSGITCVDNAGSTRTDCSVTGAVTSVADDGSGTTTITPTTGDVKVKLNLATANNWTGPQRFPVGSSTGNGSPVTVPFVGNTQTASSTGGIVTGDTYTMPVNALATGKALRITAMFLHAANTNSVTFNVRFNGTLISQFADTTSADIPTVRCDIIPLTSTTASANCIATNGSGVANTRTSLTGLNFASTIAITDTINATTANSDGTTQGLIVEWIGG